MAASLRLRGAASGLRYWSRRQQPVVASLAAENIKITIDVLILMCSRSMASKTPVGFIGVGNMGNPMAKNLMKHGYPLIIYDVFPDACKEFLDAGEQILMFHIQMSDIFLEVYTMDFNTEVEIEWKLIYPGLAKQKLRAFQIVTKAITLPSIPVALNNLPMEN
eukprot:bmy_18205T0